VPRLQPASRLLCASKLQPVEESAGSAREVIRELVVHAEPDEATDARAAPKSPFREEPDLEVSPLIPRGMGSDSGGQSGSDQGLSEEAEADSESVEELVEEGQDYEAEIILGVEEAGNAVEVGVPQHKRRNE